VVQVTDGAEPTLIGQTPWGPPLPPPQPAARAPKSMLAAALLNLTGLSLGYAYLGRWLRGGIHLALGTGLVVLALVTGAGSLPWVWRAVAFLWLLWMALDAARIAHTTPEPRRSGGVVALAVVAVVAVIGGYVAYGIAGHAAYTRGADAMGRGDCAAANGEFDTVSGPFALTLSEDVPAAQERRTECDAFAAASGTSDLGGRVAAYQAFQRDHAASPLHGLVAENLAQAQLEKVAADRPAITAATGEDRAGLVRTAVETLLSMEGGTRAAAKVPDALDEVYVSGVQGKPCDALPTVEYLIDVPDAAAAAIVGKAKADVPGRLLNCGLDQFRARDLDGAAQQLTELTTGHTTDRGVPQARAALIAVAVAKQTSDALVVPAPLDRPGSLKITLYNITSSPMKVYLTGSSAAEVELPGCSGCPAGVASGTPCPDPAGKPAVSTQVDPGLYHVLLDADAPKASNVKTIVPVQNDELCVFHTD
jgi:hypothetical protein